MAAIAAAEMAAAPTAEPAAVPADLTPDLVTPELRRAHREAFLAATKALEAELETAKEPGRTTAVLAAVRDDFAAWEDGQLDGPMPPLATVETLRPKLKFVLLDAAAWRQAPDYVGKVDDAMDAHDGGGTSLSYTLFSLFARALGKVRAYLRAGAAEAALCEAVALTRAMVLREDWWGDTDTPEAAARAVQQLAAAWAAVLAAPGLAARDLGMLTGWLEAAKESWEGPASRHLDMKLAFDFRTAAVTPRKPPATLKDAGSGAKKRKAPEAAAAADCAKKQKPDAAMEAWLHRHDNQLEERQAAALQLKCGAGDGKSAGFTMGRCLVVSGACTLRALGCAVALAFGKGTGGAPPGLCFTKTGGGAQKQLKASLKVVQALQEPMDIVTMTMEGLGEVGILLEAVARRGEAAYEAVKGKPMPRLVGADEAFGKEAWREVNRGLLRGRQPMQFKGKTKEERLEATLQHMAFPLCHGLGLPMLDQDGNGEEVPQPDHATTVAAAQAVIAARQAKA